MTGRPNRRSKTISPRLPRRRAWACNAKWSTKSRVARSSACSRPAVCAVAVAGVLVFLIEKFYDPEARARERAIAAGSHADGRAAEGHRRPHADRGRHRERDHEQRSSTWRAPLLATLVEKSPDHPRREFLQDAIDRAAELQKLARPAPVAGPGDEPACLRRAKGRRATQARGTLCRSDASTRTRNALPRGRRTARSPHVREGSVADAGRAPTARPSAKRRARRASRSTLPSIRTTSAPMQRADNFPGRTIEASDSAGGQLACVGLLSAVVRTRRVPPPWRCHPPRRPRRLRPRPSMSFPPRS